MKQMPTALVYYGIYSPLSFTHSFILLKKKRNGVSLQPCESISACSLFMMHFKLCVHCTHRCGIQCIGKETNNEWKKGKYKTNVKWILLWVGSALKGTGLPISSSLYFSFCSFVCGEWTSLPYLTSQG